MSIGNISKDFRTCLACWSPKFYSCTTWSPNSTRNDPCIRYGPKESFLKKKKEIITVLLLQLLCNHLVNYFMLSILVPCFRKKYRKIIIILICIVETEPPCIILGKMRKAMCILFLWMGWQNTWKQMCK